MNGNLYAGSFLNYFYNNLLTHLPIHFVRRGFLRLFNKRISKSCVILMHTRILNFWKIEIGERVVINQYCLLDCRQFAIAIGNDTDIGPYTRIWTLGHNPDSETHDLYGGDVIIGHHVWIASRRYPIAEYNSGRWRCSGGIGCCTQKYQPIGCCSG